MDLGQLFQQIVCGALAALGFGVLFNVRPRALAWCAFAGALALTIRSAVLIWGWNLEAASFLAALAVGATVQGLQARIGISRNTLAAVGCIPMIPGAYAARAILGLMAMTAQQPPTANTTMLAALEFSCRVMFIMGALGTGVAIPTLLTRVRPFKQQATERT